MAPNDRQIMDCWDVASSRLLHALTAIHRAGSINDSLLRDLDIITVEDPAQTAPSWLPRMLPVADTKAVVEAAAKKSLSRRFPDLLKPPTARFTPRNGREWALLFRDTKACLGGPPSDPDHCQTGRSDDDSVDHLLSGMAHARMPEFEDSWEEMLADGGSTPDEPQHSAWQVVSLLESGHFDGCILWDPELSPRPKDSLYLRSELFCLLTLAHRQLCRQKLAVPAGEPGDSEIAVTLTTFTPTTVRTLQAYLDWPETSATPTIRIAKRLESPLASMSCQTSAEPEKAWLDVLSWLSFMSRTAPLETRRQDGCAECLHVEKQRRKDDARADDGSRPDSRHVSEAMFEKGERVEDGDEEGDSGSECTTWSA